MLNKLKSIINDAQKHPSFNKYKKGLQLILLSFVLIFLFVQLSQLGWDKIWQNRPKTILFYLVGLGIYFYLPFFETIVYKLFWNIKFKEIILTLFKKRILNMDFFDYSGELFLLQWSRDHVNKPLKELMGTIKDNLLISLIVSNLGTALMVALLFSTGNLSLSAIQNTKNPVMFFVGIVTIVLALGIVFTFRKAIFFSSPQLLRKVSFVHAMRFLTISFLQVLQWWSVYPEVDFSTWAFMLAIYTVTSRLPFLPSKDIFATSLIVGLGSSINAPMEAIAALLLTRTAMEKSIGIFLFILLGFMSNKKEINK